VLVVFDCDGVLVDSELISNRVLAEQLTDLGLDMTVERSIQEFMGRDARHLLRRTAELLGNPPPEGFYDRYAAARDAAFEAGLAAVQGVAVAVDELHAAGVATCVASSGSVKKMRYTLGLTGLWERFEGRVFSAHEVEHGKPAPDLFLHAAAAMGTAPADCVVVEDAPAGVAAGKAAGMRVLGYAGLTEPESLWEADVVFSTMTELSALVLGRERVSRCG